MQRFNVFSSGPNNFDFSSCDPAIVSFAPGRPIPGSSRIIHYITSDDNNKVNNGNYNSNTKNNAHNVKEQSSHNKTVRTKKPHDYNPSVHKDDVVINIIQSNNGQFNIIKSSISPIESSQIQSYINNITPSNSNQNKTITEEKRLNYNQCQCLHNQYQ
eukprot:873680_1